MLFICRCTVQLTTHGEFCNRKKNGELYWESASISPIRDASGEITHYVAIKDDVTERKRMEDELLKATPAHMALAAARNARITLEAGFTTVRDMGTSWPYVDIELRDAIEDGWLPGPRMIVAGASSYPRCIDYGALAETAASLSAYFMVDMAHIGGLVAAGMSLVGLRIGSRLGTRFGRRMEVLGGIVLIGIGTRILIQHLLQ